MENILFNIVFTIVMLGLALWDFLSYGKQKHRDFKSIIMSAGVLGTFVGIFIGLQDFNVNEIENSVPFLLEGLKTAFYTSILGMSLAILLAIVQKGKAVKSDFENMMDYFSLQASKLDDLKYLRTIVDQNLKLQDFQEKYRLAQEENFLKISNHFDATNHTLKEAMQYLVQGASKELISALESVIRDFNQKITDQFGDNFKELNAAVLQMILWQENYKNTLEGLDENLKNTLEVFKNSQEVLEMVAERNSEVLEVYNALAHSIEASRIENQKLSEMLLGFEDMHKNAQNALESVQSLTHIMQESHIQAMDLTKQNLQEVRGYLQTSVQEHKNATQEILTGNLQVLQKDYLELSGNLSNFQKDLGEFAQGYLVQNKENMDQFLIQVQEKSEKCLDHIQKSNVELNNQNLEMLKSAKENIAEYLKKVSGSFKEALGELDKTQKESLLLLEGQTQKSDAILEQHRLELENILKNTSGTLEQMGSEAKESLLKNTNALEEHIANAVLGFDSLLGNTTKTLQENFQESKETLKEMSKDIEDSMLVVTKSLDSMLNETANSLSKSAQNIEESLVDTTQNLKDSFSKTTQNISQSVDRLLAYNQSKSEDIHKLMEQNLEDLNVNLQTMSQNAQEHYEELQNQMRSSFGESYKNAIETLGAYLKNSSNLYQNQLSKLSQNSLETLQKHHLESLQSHQGMQQDLQKSLSEIAQKFGLGSKQILGTIEGLSKELLQFSSQHLDSHSQKVIAQYHTLEEKVKSILQEMAKHYLEMLSTLTQQSLEIPKNVSAELLGEFNKLQKNLGESLSGAYMALENNRKEIEGILKIIQSNVDTSLSKTTNLNENLCRSLGDLDDALSNITLGFRQDYEWFLRRIRELMGARS